MARRPRRQLAAAARATRLKGGRLRFDSLRDVLSAARDDFGDRPRMSVDGLSLSVRLTPTVQPASLKQVERAARSLVANMAKTLARRAQVISRRTVRTGLFRDAWTARVRGTGLQFKIELTNAAPYALYVHPSGTRKSRTVVNTDIKPMVADAAEEIERVLAEFLGNAASAVAAAELDT